MIKNYTYFDEKTLQKWEVYLEVLEAKGVSMIIDYNRVEFENKDGDMAYYLCNVHEKEVVLLPVNSAKLGSQGLYYDIAEFLIEKHSQLQNYELAYISIEDVVKTLNIELKMYNKKFKEILTIANSKNDQKPDENSSVKHEQSHEKSGDMVNHPEHYNTGSVECIDLMIELFGVEAVKGFCLCNSFKYLYRNMNKNGLEDIKKSKWYQEKYLELSENTN